MEIQDLPASEVRTPTYFDLQASWGLTKHFGGVAATDELLALCHVGRGSLMLEIGCGVGITPVYAAQTLGCQVIAIDLSARMLAWARRRVQRLGLEDDVRLINANAEQLPFGDDYFDAVFCESVTAFVPDKARALSEYVRVVRPGGYVAMTEGLWLKTPPPELVEYLTRAMNGPEFLTLEQWTALLRNAGLAIAAASRRHVNAIGQWLSEMGRMDWADAAQYAQAWKTLSRLAATDADFRDYIRSLKPSASTIFQMFDYFGYGIVVGRKPADAGG